MFTGIIQRTASITAVEPGDFGVTLVVDADDWSHHPHRGDSIAVNGCCLTVRDEPVGGLLRFDVIQQTLRMTSLGRLETDDRVNLEHAVTPTTLLGGHIVQGHVDGLATVVELLATDSEWRLRLEPPADLLEFIVDKGSVTLDGVSLTVASLADTTFEVALIPTTLQDTTLGRTRVGDRLNIETDCIARMVAHWLRRQGAAGATPSPS